MAGKKNTRKLDAERRRREAAAARREEHAKLVVDRQGDPRYIQRRRSPAARTIEWTRDSSAGKQLEESLRRQRAAFIGKFGREPGPDDPIFFDPNADEPTPLGAVTESDIWEDMLAAAEQAGIDPALIHARLRGTDRRHLPGVEPRMRGAEEAGDPIVLIAVKAACVAERTGAECPTE